MILAAILVSGTLFADLDHDGVFSAGDTPVAGAKVVWETSVWATTNAAGAYELEAPGPGIVWVRTPDGFSPAPVWGRVTSGAEATVDLALSPSAASGPLTFVQSGDTHVGTVGRDETRRSLEQATDLVPAPHFYSITGDLTAGERSQYETLEAARSGIAVPFVPVPGNHDWHDGGVLYRELYGPPMYSFEAGGVHFVVLNFNASEGAQLAFARADLADVPADRTIIAFAHAPLSDAVATALEAIGVDYAFTAHEHSNRLYDHGSLVDVNTETFVMGGIDFTPAGYRVVRVDGADLTMTHHTVVRSRYVNLTYPSPRSCIAPGRIRAIAAAELGATPAAVTVRIGDGPEVPLAATGGGWTFAGELDVPAVAGAWQTAKVVARGGAGDAVTRDVPFCSLAAPIAHPATVPDWTQLQGSSQHQGAIAAPIAPPLVIAWARPLGGHVRGGSPVVAGGRVFVPVLDLAGKTGGGVVAFDAITGEPLWEARGASVGNAPAVADGTVVFASIDGIVHAHDAATGVERWRYDLAAGLERQFSSLYGAPAIAGGRVYLGNQARFAAIDLATGAEIWQFASTDTLRAASYAAPAITGDTGVSAVGRGAKSIAAWTASAYAPKWAIDLPPATRTYASPVADDATVYIANVEKQTSAVDLATGAQRWTRALYGDSDWAWWVLGSPALAHGKLFIPTPRNKLFALDASTGATSWVASSGASIVHPVPYKTDVSGFASSPVVTGDVVWAGGMDGVLYAFDAGNGAERWRLDLGAPILAGPAPAPPYLYVATYDGTIRALVSDPGQKLPATPSSSSGCSCRADRGGGGALLVLGVLLVVTRARGGRRRCA